MDEQKQIPTEEPHDHEAEMDQAKKELFETIKRLVPEQVIQMHGQVLHNNNGEAVGENLLLLTNKGRIFTRSFPGDGRWTEVELPLL